MPRHSHGRLLVLLVVSILALLPSAPLPTSAAPAPPVLSTSIMPAAPPPANTAPPHATVTGIPPLPRSCIRGGTPLDSFVESVCCVSGFVYLNGVPVAGADVTISVAGRTLTTTTNSGPDRGQPYYAASLNAAPLSAKPGDSVTISASASGQSKSVTFTAQEGGQQIDVALPQSALNATWTPGEQAMPELRQAAMVYDSTRRRTLLFGGLANGVPSDKTWEWDGTSWLRRTPIVTPPARSGHALAYDSARQRMVLFGGTATTGITLTDTWEWDGATWLERTPSSPLTLSGPPALVYDSLRARVLLIGASADKLATWAWDGTTWTQLTTTGAPARTGFSFAYDATRDRVVIFGGTRAGVLQQDTWEFNGTAWVRAFPLNTPTARNSHATTYDSVRQQVVLVGGVDATAKPLEDSWSYDGSTWTVLNVDLPPRANALLTYDSARNLVILVGGYSDAAATTYPNETWELDAIDWNQRAPRASPPVLSGQKYSLVYDVARKRVVAFDYLYSVWEWDRISWTPRMPLIVPTDLRSSSMVYDEARQQIVAFGGLTLAGGRSDATWVWDHLTWRQVQPVNAPPPRSQHSMAYDSVRQRVVIYGGAKDNSGNSWYDTWEWDGTTWTERTPTISPSMAYYRMAMAYDAAHEQTVLLGFSSIPTTWVWNGSNWIQLTTAHHPPYSSGAYSMVFDTARQHVVLLSMNTGTLEMWEWDGADWSQVVLSDIPPGRSSYGLASDTLQQQLVLFGGYAISTSALLGDTWIWNGTTWHEQIDDSYVPGQLSAAAMDDTHDGFSLLFGGRKPDASLSGRTFHWQGNRWLMLDPATTPPARQAHQIARNGDGSLLLMFGGKDAGGGYLDDTWLWNGSDWQLHAPTSHPTARADYSLTYDTRRKVWVLFGGQNSGARLNDTWEYDGSAWRQISPLNAPPARAGATLTYDQRRGVAVLVGGQSGGALNDVWEYDGTTWANVTPTQPLAARFGHGAAYDPSRDVVLVTGGMDETGAVRGDTWEWNGTFWRERIAATPLTARTRMAVAYDTERGELVAFGGEDASGTILADTQLHQASGSLSVPVPIATISRITPRDARQGVDTISFEGRGADTDSTDMINAYRWTSNGSVISTSRTFTKPAAEFPLGAQSISFDVQDNEGVWSPAIEQTIYIRNGDGGGLTTNKSWTLMIYAAADNNLDPWMGENSAFNGMLYRLQKAGPLANVQVAILYDGPGANDTYHYTLDASGAWTKTPQPEAQMDAMETLRDFVIWGRGGSGLPATDYYALAIVDHANGIVGIAQDETSKSAGNTRPFLTPLELRVALQAATDDGARKLDVIHYDGCSFGLFEDAAIAAGLTNFVIASPNTGWGVFAYDSYRQLAASAADPHAYAISVAGRYAELVTAEQLPYTISVFDMADFVALNTAISGLGQSLLTYVQADIAARRDTIKTLRLTMQKYDSGEGTPIEPNDEDNYVDVVDLAQKFKGGINDSAVQTAADQVIALALPSNQRFVAYESHLTKSFPYVDPTHGGERTYNVQLDNAHGLGLYYPPRSSANPKSAYTTYIQHQLFDITRDSGWTKFIGQGLPAQLDMTFPPLLSDSLMPLYIPQDVATPTPTSHVFLPLIHR